MRHVFAVIAGGVSIFVVGVMLGAAIFVSEDSRPTLSRAETAFCFASAIVLEGFYLAIVLW